MRRDSEFDVRVIAVRQGLVPPYAYTDGLRETHAYELVCAWALALNVDAVADLLRTTSRGLALHSSVQRSSDRDGPGGLHQVSRDWVSALDPLPWRDGWNGPWYQVTPD